jgi:deoxyribonuclease IV
MMCCMSAEADAAPGRPVGAHVLVAGGLATAGLRYARQIGAEAIQVFTSNPRGWALAAGDPREDAAFRDQVTAAGLPVFVHAPYLINPASPDQVTRERSAASLRHALARGTAIGARGVVVHTGSAVGGDRGRALRLVRETLLPVLDSLSGQAPDLLLEPMAGQGGMLCCAAGDLGPYLDALNWHPRAKICLDTCHLFAAGHDLAGSGGVARLLAELGVLADEDPERRRGGRPGRLALIHANDSKDPCGSGRDRHQNIGAGHIGTGALRDLLTAPATAGVPFVAETPGPLAAHTADVTALKDLRAPAPAPPAAAAAAAARG